MPFSRYSCGPYAKFKNISGDNEWQDTVTATCNWNKAWTPNPIPPCSRKLKITYDASMLNTESN